MHQTTVTHNYRSDIDGLRALAVISVVIFHAFPWLIPGGYVGVDVFFVISGYLITTNILHGLNDSTFTIGGFYQRRVRRIFPALVTMLAVIYILGWFILFASEYRQLGKHVGSGASFISNLVLWKEAGYFDTASAVKPLTHLWSLGIEEQFYIVWPLVLWLIVKIRTWVVASTVFLTLISFGYGLWSLDHDTTGAYYSPFNRFWELLIGAILANVMLKRIHRDTASRQQQLVAVLGTSLIVLSMMTLNEQSSFPGLNALPPTIGAALLIGSGSRTWMAHHIFSRRAMVWIGLISFPLYLWHWPLLTYARVISSAVPSAQVRIGAVLLAVLLSWATYRLIEKPLRFHRRVNVVTAALVGVMILVGSVGFLTFAKDGISTREVARINPQIEVVADIEANPNVIPECGIDNPDDQDLLLHCVSDTRSPARFALIGDSKAEVLISGLIETSQDSGRWLFMGGTRATSAVGPPVLLISDDPDFERFQRSARIAIDAIINSPTVDVVVLQASARAIFGIADESSFDTLPTSPYYEAITTGLRQAITELTQAGKKVVLYFDNPPLPNPEDCLERKTTIGFLNSLLIEPNPRCELPLATFLEQTAKYRAMLELLMNEFEGDVFIFEATEVFCDASDRICRHTINNRLMYSYTDHPSNYAATIIGQRLNPYLESLEP